MARAPCTVQVDVRNRHCEEPNCTKCPSFNFPGLKPGVCTAACTSAAGMVDVKHKRNRAGVADDGGLAPIGAAPKPKTPSTIVPGIGDASLASWGASACPMRFWAVPV